MIDNVFGISITYENWDKQRALPLYIAAGYNFQLAYIEHIRCIIITPREQLATIPALKKQIDQIKKVDNAHVVLRLEKVSFYRRKSLIENKIPFFTDKQLYLPFIGTLLTDEKETDIKLERFTVSTQMLFLAYWYNDKKQIYVSELAKFLPFSAMTISRAVKQLEVTNLFLITKDGVNKVIESKYDKKDLFEGIKQYLSSPIYKSGYIEKENAKKNMILAGESALSDKTMLNPSRVKTYAVYDKEYDQTLLEEELVNPEKQVKVEIWKYDPSIFSDKNMVDNISLVLSFRENTDERIEEAIEELMEREWINID